MRLIYDTCEICGEPFKIKEGLTLFNESTMYKNNRCNKCKVNKLILEIMKINTIEETRNEVNKLMGGKYYE
jgi:hypothetical protein